MYNYEFVESINFLSYCYQKSLDKILWKNLWKGRNKLFLVYKNYKEILYKLKTNGFQASTISTYDFSSLYTTLPNNLIRNQLVDLIENTFRRVEVLYFACNAECAFFASKEHKNMIYGLVKK